jgi:hypothetical protein
MTQAAGEIDEICVIDLDAKRRVMVAQEQFELQSRVRLHVYEGNIGHPQIWQNFEREVNLSGREPLFLLGTGTDEENLRSGLWLRRKYPGAKIIVRTSRPSVFAASFEEDTGIQAFGMSQAIQDALPDEWFRAPQ